MSVSIAAKLSLVEVMTTAISTRTSCPAWNVRDAEKPRLIVLGRSPLNILMVFKYEMLMRIESGEMMV